jgi:hypothetical protein
MDIDPYKLLIHNAQPLSSPSAVTCATSSTSQSSPTTSSPRFPPPTIPATHINPHRGTRYFRCARNTGSTQNPDTESRIPPPRSDRGGGQSDLKSHSDFYGLNIRIPRSESRLVVQNRNPDKQCRLIMRNGPAGAAGGLRVPDPQRGTPGRADLLPRWVPLPH